MCRRLLVLALLSAAPATLPAQTAVDTAGAGALIAQAMDHSEVMANLRQMSDIIGPRLSGSAAMRRANDWTAERFRAYGLTASLEPYTFGVTWARGPGSRPRTRSPASTTRPGCGGAQAVPAGVLPARD